MIVTSVELWDNPLSFIVLSEFSWKGKIKEKRKERKRKENERKKKEKSERKIKVVCIIYL